jgi:hypothetical protein
VGVCCLESCGVNIPVRASPKRRIRLLLGTRSGRLLALQLFAPLSQRLEYRADAAAGRPASSPVAGELWYIRKYALDQQEPVSRDSTFVRVDRTDAFVPKLELSGFANVDMYDRSGLLQLSADYYLSDAWTVGGIASATYGGSHSDFGSLPTAGSVLFRVARYFLATGNER